METICWDCSRGYAADSERQEKNRKINRLSTRRRLNKILCLKIIIIIRIRCNSITGCIMYGYTIYRMYNVWLRNT